MRLRLAILVVSSVVAISARPCFAQMFPPQFREVGIEQHLGAQIPLDLVFRDQDGKAVTLREYWHGKPVLLIPVYYTCPTLCSHALHGLVDAIGLLHLKPASDFEIVAFSIAPGERPSDARKKLDDCTMNYSGRRGGPGWHFLTSSQASITELTRAIGFRYRDDAQPGTYVHASGLLVTTPEGRISSYLLGVSYQPADLQKAVFSAAESDEGSSTGVRLLCYQFANTTGRYTNLVLRTLRLTTALMLCALVALLVFLWRFDLRQHRGDARWRSLS